MLIRCFIWVAACFIAGVGPAVALEHGGPIAQWDFDEGQGDIANDASGNGHNVNLYDVAWVEQADGHALQFDGKGGHVDLGASAELVLDGPIGIELWVKPMAKGHGEACLIGESMQSFFISYYNAEYTYWYIGGGDNGISGQLDLGRWNHLAVSFDGETMSMWINGRLVGSRESKYEQYSPVLHSTIGTSGGGNPARFKGVIDAVRIYDRPLESGEVVERFKRTAGDYGFDTRWFSRVKATPYYYFDRDQIVIEADYRGLQPLGAAARLTMKLARGDDIVHEQTLDELPESGVAEIVMPAPDLSPGDYSIRVELAEGESPRPLETFAFSYPSSPPAIPAPAEKTVSHLATRGTSTPYALTVGETGGFTLDINGVQYPFVTRVSWPRGEFNHLSDEKVGEQTWRVDTAHKDDRCHAIDAQGEHYTLHRQIEALPTHVYVKDTYTNTTDQDLGLLIYNEMSVVPGQIERSLLGGFEGRTRSHAGESDLFCPSVFVNDDNAGIGIVPTDDVFIVQSVMYNEPQVVGLGTERFALAPGDSYTLEWAVYPTGSGDYYDFVNAFRQAEGRIGTADGGFGFSSFGPMNRRQVQDEAFFENRGMRYAVLHTVSRVADDPQISVEGIEFMDFPREMDLLRRQAAVLRRKHPDRRFMFHVAHSLYMTDKPDRFADSKVIGPDGQHAVWGANEPYVTKQRQDEGWTWWIYYPTPGNSFHDALLHSADVMMDDLGMDGVFMDGFLAGYQGQWTFDGRWDGHSAEIDPSTKTITRKIGSVILLSQPSMIEFARKVRNKGGKLIANNTMMTRSIANETHILFEQEVASGPHIHLAPTVIAIARPPAQSETDIYRDMLDKLSWGELFGYYLERINLTGPSLAAKQYPMTFEEIRSGMVRGPERIVTMNSGVYNWPGLTDLHLVHKFDPRGVPVPHDFITTIDTGGVRTELDLGEHESAVIEPIPVTLKTDEPVNALVTYYDGDSLGLMLNGSGELTLDLFVGTSYPDKRDGVLTDGGMNPGVYGIGNAYRVKIGDAEQTIEERDGTLAISLSLNGQVMIVVEPLQAEQVRLKELP